MTALSSNGLRLGEHEEDLPLTFMTAESVGDVALISSAQQKLGMEIDTWDTRTQNPDTR